MKSELIDRCSFSHDQEPTGGQACRAMSATRDLQCLGLRRLEVESGLGDESADEVGPVLHPLSQVLTSAVSWSRLCLARLATPSTGLNSGTYGGSWYTVSQLHVGRVREDAEPVRAPQIRRPHRDLFRL